jgi:hypothetical protein
MTLLLLAALVLLVYAFRHERRHGPDRTPMPAVPPRDGPQRATIADLAFDYARAVLELDTVNEATKDRALRALEWTIVPLTGQLPLADMTPELHARVRAVIAAEPEGDASAAVLVWDDLLRWGLGRPPLNRGQ